MTKPPVWSDAETDYLLSIAGDLPWPMLPGIYGRWAQRHGYAQRTPKALRLRIDKAGGTTTAAGAWISTGSIAITLGIHSQTPAHWCRRYPEILEPYQRHASLRRGYQRRGPIFVRRDRLRRFARLHPARFGGLPLGPLVMVLEDEGLAEHIVASYPVRPGPGSPPIPVRARETGQQFPSMAAAAKAVFVSDSSIWEAIRGRNQTAAGLHWEAVA